MLLKILQILILCTKFFFNLDEQLWKLEGTDKLINKAHGDVQLTLEMSNQVDQFTINIRKTAATDMLLDIKATNFGNEIIEVALGSLTSKKWKKFPPNCAGYFRICTVNLTLLLTAPTSNNFVLELPSRTAATISGKSEPWFFSNWYLNFDDLLIGLLFLVYVISKAIWYLLNFQIFECYVIFIYFQAAVSSFLAVSVLYFEKIYK